MQTDPASLSHTRSELLLAILGVAATVVLVAFDSTIVSTTLPDVAQALNGMSLYAWVGTGYLLATATSIMIFGRLGDMFGRKQWMLLSVVIVALGSIACGLSQNMVQLIAFRTVQGVGAGMMTATAFAAPADLFPDPKQRIKWMSIVSATFAVASGIGPILGGIATEAYGWRAAFFIIPIAAIVAFGLIARYFPTIRPVHTEQPKIDWAGALLLLLAVGCPLAAIKLGFAPADEAHPALAITLTLLGLIALAILVPLERRVAAPIFPLRIIASNQARLLNIVSMMIGAVMFVLIFYSPLFLQKELHFSPKAAGLLLAPLVATIPLGSIINGRLFHKQSEPQRLMVFGASLLAIGCAMLLLLSADTSSIWILAAFASSGLALGFLLSNITLFMQMLSQRNDVGVASALVQTTRSMGSAIGAAIVGVLISRFAIAAGVRWGWALCVVLSIGSAVLAQRIKMKNIIA